MSLQLKGKAGRGLDRPSALCMEPTSTKLLNQTEQTQRNKVGYVIPAKGFPDFKERGRFGGEMMASSLTSLERGVAVDKYDKTTSMNAYATTGSVCRQLRRGLAAPVPTAYRTRGHVNKHGI